MSVDILTGAGGGIDDPSKYALPASFENRVALQIGDLVIAGLTLSTTAGLHTLILRLYEKLTGDKDTLSVSFAYVVIMSTVTVSFVIWWNRLVRKRRDKIRAWHKQQRAVNDGGVVKGTSAAAETAATMPASRPFAQ